MIWCFITVIMIVCLLMKYNKEQLKTVNPDAGQPVISGK